MQRNAKNFKYFSSSVRTKLPSPPSLFIICIILVEEGAVRKSWLSRRSKARCRAFLKEKDLNHRLGEVEKAVLMFVKMLVACFRKNYIFRKR